MSLPLTWLLILPALAQEVTNPLPCLDSSPQCLHQLTQLAITHNLEMATLERRIELAGSTASQARARLWTNYLDVNPVGLLQTVFGGGRIQQADLQIAELDLRGAELERRRAELQQQLGSQVQQHVLTYERLQQEHTILESRLQVHSERVRLIEIGYRLGEGSTESMLPLWQQGEEIAAQITHNQVEAKAEILQLIYLTGY